ncbi:MAG: peptidoglycan bridge formation glycyltransferase FemA/FemB family protein [Bacilli bacterium]|nr:peptidoglycan bridge formation glycyltransferase FemA/FemB family protein [Bacilli bacterium]
MKVIALTPELFDKYSMNYPNTSYYQTSKYGNVMQNFDYYVQYIGIIDDTKTLVGATMILYRTVFMNYKEAYAPRGILLNYEKTDLLQEAIEVLKKALKKQNIMVLKMDPYIPISIRDKKGTRLNVNTKANLIMANLQSTGFNYLGKTKQFEGEKPRWEAMTTINRDLREIYASFDKRTRHKIRKALNSGVQVYKDPQKSTRALFGFIKYKHHEVASYYRHLIDSFGDATDVYYAKINTEIFVVNSRRLYEREMAKNDAMSREIQNPELDTKEKNKLLNKKMDSDRLLNVYKNSLVRATDLLKKYPNGMIIAGALTLCYNNTVYIITEGYNTEYGYLNAGYLIKWNIINDFNKKEYQYLNLNAVIGLFNKKTQYSGLNEMKAGFNAVFMEYIGEFELITNNFAYNLNNKFNKDK